MAAPWPPCRDRPYSAFVNQAFSGFLNHMMCTLEPSQKGANMSDGVMLLVGGLAVGVNVAVLWLTLRMARRATWYFDNTR
jgi:hypothetical protein